LIAVTHSILLQLEVVYLLDCSATLEFSNVAATSIVCPGS